MHAYAADTNFVKAIQCRTAKIIWPDEVILTTEHIILLLIKYATYGILLSIHKWSWTRGVTMQRKTFIKIALQINVLWFCKSGQSNPAVRYTYIIYMKIRKYVPIYLEHVVDNRILKAHIMTTKVLVYS